MSLPFVPVHARILRGHPLSLGALLVPQQGLQRRQPITAILRHQRAYYTCERQKQRQRASENRHGSEYHERLLDEDYRKRCTCDAQRDQPPRRR